MTTRVAVTPADDGAFWRVAFGGGKGNVLDRDTMLALAGVFHEAGDASALKAIVLEGMGAEFSFGASVQEHLPGEVERMLETFRDLVLALLDSSVTVLAAVRGQCLGGGLELASVCHRVFAARDAVFGQPEIALGVFAPLGSIVLPGRVGRANAEDLCLTGRKMLAEEAHRMGLADALVDGDPADAAMAWARAYLAPRSASSLRLAVKAIRADLTARIRTELPALERLYLSELMKTNDAVEGLRAFLEKRPPVWRNG